MKLCCNSPTQDWISMLPKALTICSSHPFVFILKEDAFAYHSIQVKVVSLMLINDWGDKNEAQEPTLDREFLSSLEDI